MPLTRTGKWTVLASVVTVEVAAVYVTWYHWDHLNRSQDYRKWMHTNHPRILNLFYQSCTLAGVQDAKERDYRDWGIRK